MKLENEKYFVGKTTNPNFKVENIPILYKNLSKLSDFVVFNKPIKVIEFIPNCTEQDVDKYTLKYMKQYGIRNVRGGTYAQDLLTNETKERLKYLIETKKL